MIGIWAPLLAVLMQAPSAQILARFSEACAAVQPAQRAVSVCGTPLPDASAAFDFVHRLPDGGDWGMPDAWSAMRVARAHLVLAGAAAWTDTAWDVSARMHRRPAFEALTHALDLEPGFVPAMVILNAVSPYPQLWMKLPDELKQLRAVPLARLPASLFAARVLVELESGHESEAAAIHDSLFLRYPENPDLLYLDAVLTARKGPVGTAWRRYLAAIAAPGGTAPEGWAVYEALRVPDSTDKEAWQATGPRDRANWLRTFWEMRDLQTAAIPGTRWVVHQHRWIGALRQYRLAPFGGLHDERRPVELMQLPPTMVSDMDSTLEAGDPHLLRAVCTGASRERLVRGSPPYRDEFSMTAA